MATTGQPDNPTLLSTHTHTYDDSASGGFAAAVNFDGTGTVSIRDSSNVSSITDLGAGEYQINFTTNMPDVNYYTSVTGSDEVGANNRKTDACIIEQAVNYVKVGFYGSYSGGGADQEICCVIVFNGSGSGGGGAASFGARQIKLFNTIYYSEVDAIVTAEHTYSSSWPNMIAYADTNSSPTTERLGHNSNDTGGGQVAMTFVVRAGEYWKVSIDGSYTDQEIVYTPMNGTPTQVNAFWDSGWVDTDGTTSVGNAATLNFDHGLGTTAINWTLYAATSVAGANNVNVSLHPLGGGTSATVVHGAQVQSVTSSAVTLQLADSGYTKLESDGDLASVGSYSIAFTYIKLVGIAAGGGGLSTKQTFTETGGTPDGDDGIFCNIPACVNEVNVMVNSVCFDGDANSVLAIRLGSSAGLETTDAQYRFNTHFHAPYAASAAHYSISSVNCTAYQGFFPITSCIASVDVEEGGDYSSWKGGLMGVASLHRTDGNCWTITSNISHAHTTFSSAGWTNLSGVLDRLEIRGRCCDGSWGLQSGTANISYR